MKKNLLVIIVIFVVIGFLSYVYWQRNQGQAKAELPSYALRNNDVKSAYQYAVAHPELLENLPCYCNCAKLGHKNLVSCFVKRFTDDDKVIFEEHGADCGICYASVLDAEKLYQAGKSTQEVRNFIDQKYSRYGRPTPTPQP